MLQRALKLHDVAVLEPVCEGRAENRCDGPAVNFSGVFNQVRDARSQPKATVALHSQPVADRSANNAVQIVRKHRYIVRARATRRLRFQKQVTIGTGNGT